MVVTEKRKEKNWERKKFKKKKERKTSSPFFTAFPVTLLGHFSCFLPQVCQPPSPAPCYPSALQERQRREQRNHGGARGALAASPSA